VEAVLVRISLVISTTNRPREISALLNSLYRQTVKPHQVVVVDQSADNATERSVLASKNELPVTYLRDDRKGLSRGRNLGVSLVNGDVVAFPDDDCVYPPENVELAAEIAERGAIVSEMPFGWEPRARDFPRRNRLVAGLCIGLVVVEAANRSGSLISARLAGEMGRLVFAVPGSPLDPRAAGSNRLLKDGATIVTSAEDVIAQIRPMAGDGPPPLPPALEEPPDLSATPPAGDDERALVHEALGPTPVSVDEIIRHTGLGAAQVHLILLELDLAGRLARQAGGLVSLRPDDT
jgi:DNA processing protein